MKWASSKVGSGRRFARGSGRKLRSSIRLISTVKWAAASLELLQLGWSYAKAATFIKQNSLFSDFGSLQNREAIK